MLTAVVTALAFAPSAFAHARVSPSPVEAGQGQVFALAVPTEKVGATTTKVELTVPAGFSIDSFAASPGWKRSTQQRGSGEASVIERVTWSGGHVPTGEDALFQFLAEASSAKTYRFAVRQTYSDGSVVDWSGPESSDTPAPVLEAKSSLGGCGGTSTLTIVALALAGVALVVAVAGLLTGGGRREVA